ncbi:MAG: NDP-hexose 2,3-dehydratase family protein [bacterium]
MVSKKRWEKEFLKSALVKEGILKLSEFFRWLENRCQANTFLVEKTSLNKLKGWYFEKDTGNLVHESGKFFRIEGIDVQTNFGHTSHWMQPIINQPEIGILGFLVKKINGVVHFLVQAKMEPGNVNLVQISPTVQATRSNFTQVHGGSRPKYLDYFLDRKNNKFLIDQLQSEQGSRFLCKRNRNMIVEIQEDEDIEVYDDFCWLTLGQLFELLKIDNLINMDSRTVLSCIRFDDNEDNLNYLLKNRDKLSFDQAVLLSSLRNEPEAVNDFDNIVSWFTHMKTHYELKISRIALNQVKGWQNDGNVIRAENGKYFSIIGVAVKASNREVQGWEQPLIESAKGGILCFICQKKNGILHFLIQGRVEPGNFDCLEMAPTLQCTPSNYEQTNLFPPFYDFVVNARPDQIRYSALQSEEGGRFYHDQNRYLVIEADEDEELKLPDNYVWMTIHQIKGFIRFNNYLNIEARGLLSCLSVQSSQ